MELAKQYSDVVIFGGGLAGLTLALQLKQKLPEISITVIERQAMPFPEAAHKVGESTVEIAAHYFATTLGLQEHLRSKQLIKLGLRLFFSNQNQQPIEQRPEMGSNKHLHLSTYQIDRGRFENFLADKDRKINSLSASS